MSRRIDLTALIDGVQKDLIDKTLGTQAHIVVEPQGDVPKRSSSPNPSQHDTAKNETLYLSRIQQPAKRLKSIESWPRALQKVRAVEGVRAAAPVSRKGFRSYFLMKGFTYPAGYAENAGGTGGLRNATLTSSSLLNEKLHS